MTTSHLGVLLHTKSLKSTPCHSSIYSKIWRSTNTLGIDISLWIGTYNHIWNVTVALFHSPGSIVSHYFVITFTEDGDKDHEAIKAIINAAVSSGTIDNQVTLNTDIQIIYHVHIQTKPKGKYDFIVYFIFSLVIVL